MILVIVLIDLLCGCLILLLVNPTLRATHWNRMRARGWSPLRCRIFMIVTDSAVVLFGLPWVLLHGLSRLVVRKS